MVAFMTVDKGLIKARALVRDDFVILNDKWFVPTLESVMRDRECHASITLNLKDEALDNLVAVWKEHCGARLWQDWRLTDDKTKYDGKITLHTHTPRIKVDFRGCKTQESKERKAKDAIRQTEDYVRRIGGSLIGGLIQEFNERVARQLNDRNGWKIQEAVEQFAINLAGYPKLQEVPNRKTYIEEIERLRGIVEQKRIELQRLDRQYVLGIWEGKDGLEFPVEIREPVIAKLKEDLATLEKGEVLTGHFGLPL
jgi:hypothetical protein